MSTNERPASGHDENRERQLQGSGIAFLGSGVAFLGVGVATKMIVFTMLAPTFIALGIVFLVRARRRPHGDGQR
ncbi:hypothetical protein FNZ56_09350 [Pseudoluteimonas lycopersici]|uniref:Uncharacterized protein n=1 Tax=Pseudoluteimonas lycopersici TaxID=1324796 RepID=A0A516V6F3_9GAMM|nr:hypothetical protein [Lysobacter lycopersici]QDQ74071.1 hypothetical protein FNZ56_09350 [Lysobacter lycopersici]